ncbi:CdaR family protein [Fictibacillus fluitans]|uniref:CdaR family protein n=1 Tax=Fictibacillus fluitans TaxID=3058422 RepID=A0ABT8I2N8_9BACL|nr:CdaR family protein [Fictibacillus sp. NE201]MDN4527241.1 CdaR family protein [Fictibacillus sp. NE201]
MDKLLRSNWFVKIIAFLLALMLYTVLSMEDQQQTSRNALFTSVSKNTQSVNGVEIVPYFDENKYVLTDMPRSVDVKLTGESNLLTKALKVDRRIEVYIDLTKLGPGTHTVPVKLKNVPDELEAEPSPKQVKVTLHQKQTRQIPVSIDLKNKTKLPEGYETGSVDFSPKTVYVTGPDEYINRIESVRATVDVSNAKDKVETRVPLRAYDSQGNLLDVLIDPKSVNVTVPISKPEKTVPLRINQKGDLPEGLTLAGISFDPKEVTLSGPSSTLDNINEISGVDVDLSKIKEDSTVDVDVPLPDGAESVSPKQVKVKVDVEKDTGSKTIKNVPIEIRGENSEQPASFVSPSDGKMDVTISGSKKAIEGLDASDITSYVDVNNLEPGEHTVTIHASNSKNLKMETEVSEAAISIKEPASETNGAEEPEQDNETSPKPDVNSTTKEDDGQKENPAVAKSKSEEKSDPNESQTEGEN